MTASQVAPNLASKCARNCHATGVQPVHQQGIAGPTDGFGYDKMKRAPAGKPDWVDVCTIEHRSGNIIDFPIVNDLACLLWIVNLGCIDLNQWYAKCDDVNRPDYLHFDLDPVPGDAQLKVLEIVAPIQVANGDIASQDAADAALASLLYPDFAKKADPSRVG